MSSHTPKQSHPLPTFDSDLLDQIIEIEIDSATRQMEEKGKHVDQATVRQWNSTLTEMITHIMEEEHGSRVLFPADFQKLLKTMIADLADSYADTATRYAPPKRLWTPFRRFWQFLFETPGKKASS